MIADEDKKLLKELGFRYVALDENGRGYAYFNKPVIQSDHWTCAIDSDSYHSFEELHIKTGNVANWEESLEEL